MKTMTPLQAYEFALEKIDEIRSLGIKVGIVPTRSSTDEKLREKYKVEDSNPTRIPYQKWVHVTFFVNDENESKTVYEAQRYLSM